MLQYLSKFHADSYYPATHINKTAAGNSSVHPDFPAPHTGFLLISNFFLIFSNFSSIPVPHSARSDRHVSHPLVYEVSARLESRPDQRNSIFLPRDDVSNHHPAQWYRHFPSCNFQSSYLIHVLTADSTDLF